VRIELPIESKRLVIRPVVLADADDLAEDPAWIQEKIDRYDRDGGMSLWAAVDKESGKAVALAGLQWEEIEGKREIDLGCVVAKHAQLHGYGTEASIAILQAAFTAGFERVTALTKPDNEVALRVLEKLGFTRHGETDLGESHYAFFSLASPV
jgi:RimJ/RimL family protein N-acetyltransferase